MSHPQQYLYHEDLYHIPATRLIVVLARPWEEYTEDHKTLLSKILGSVKLNLASVQIIQKTQLSLDQLSTFGSPRVLVFGNLISQLKSYENQAAQGFSVIQADDLPALDEARKKNLWIALRSMFGV